MAAALRAVPPAAACLLLAASGVLAAGPTCAPAGLAAVADDDDGVESCLLHRSSSVVHRGAGHGAALADGTGQGWPKHPADCQLIQLRALSWNVHFQCSEDEQCRNQARDRFVELARNAHVAVAIELQTGQLGHLEPLALTAPGHLHGWSQVNGSCNFSDTITLVVNVAERNFLERHAGGCLSLQNGDARAYAVARVNLHQPIKHCPALCVVAVHAPLGDAVIMNGSGPRAVMTSICGDLLERCVVAMGDWNRPASDVPAFWRLAIGDSPPLLPLIQPDQATCCFNGTETLQYDHVATNVQGAGLHSAVVLPYQVRWAEEHQPVMVALDLPKP